MSKYLEKILDYKRQELEHRKRKVSLKDVRLQAEEGEPVRDFIGVLKGKETKVIAEIKKASPSAGVIRQDFNPVSLAQIFADNGAAALSVLTDEHFFQGSLGSLGEIRKKVKVPLLRKDFTFDAYQIYEARGAGADAVLLIVRILEDSQLRDYLSLADELGMAALVEVHNEKEMDRAVRLSGPLIGINNRDLDTFKVDLETTLKLAKLAPSESVLVSESGISTRDDLKKLGDAEVHAFLIGETLLRAQNPGQKLQELLKT